MLRSVQNRENRRMMKRTLWKICKGNDQCHHHKHRSVCPERVKVRRVSDPNPDIFDCHFKSGGALFEFSKSATTRPIKRRPAS